MEQKKKSINMKRIGRKIASWLLTVAMVLGLMPGMSLTALAEGTTYSPASEYNDYGTLNSNGTTVQIEGVKIGDTIVDWYVIGYNSTDKTVTLLSKQSFASKPFNSDYTVGNANAYASSEIKGYVEGLTGENQPLAGIKDVLADVSVTNPDVTGKVPYLLSISEAQNLSETKRKGGGSNWWLRSPGSNFYYQAAIVFAHTGEVYDGGNNVNDDSLGVRPALKLNLESVIFSSESNTFSLPAHEHSFTYAADGATITATCSNEDGGHNGGFTATLTIGAENATYDGSMHGATITGSIDGVNNPDIYYEGVSPTSYDSSTTAPTDVGTYKATITLSGVALTGGGTGNVTASKIFSITPATLTGVSVTQSGTLTYNKSAQTPTVTTAATAVGNQSVTFKYSKTVDGTYGDMPTVTNVSDGGTFYYKASAPNHSDATGRFTVTVEHKRVTPSLTGTVSKVYDGNNYITGVTTTTNTLGINLDGVESGDEVSATIGMATYISPDVGTNINVRATNIGLRGRDAENYMLAKESCSSNVGTITVKPLTTNDVRILISPASYPWTGNAITPENVRILYGNSDLDAKYYDVAYSNNTDIGTNATATVTFNGNYSGTATAYYSITKKDSTISTPPVANTLTYNKTAQTLISAGTATGGTLWYRLGNSGTWVDSLDTITGTEAGNYTVYYYLAGDEHHSDLGSETSSYGNVAVTIQQKEVGLSWSDTDFSYDGQPHVPAATATELKDGDTCTVTVTGAQTIAGTYTATATALSNSNYKLPTDATRQFSIKGAKVSGTAKYGSTLTASLTPEGMDPTYKWQYSTDGSAWEDISGAASSTFIIANPDGVNLVGKIIRVVITDNETVFISNATSSVVKQDNANPDKNPASGDITITADKFTVIPVAPGYEYIVVPKTIPTTTPTEQQWASNGKKGTDENKDTGLEFPKDSNGNALTPETEYEILVRYPGDDVTSPTVPTRTEVKTYPVMVTGVTISGTAQYGKSLSSTVTPVNAGGTLSYQWKRSADGETWGDISGATNATYTISSAEDIDKFIRLEVTQKDGERTVVTVVSDSTTSKVSKQNGEVKFDFTAERYAEVTDNTITIKGIDPELYEYQIRVKDTGDYGEGTHTQDNSKDTYTFTGLTAQTGYEIRIRRKGTSIQEAGTWSDPITVSTLDKPVLTGGPYKVEFTPATMVYGNPMPVVSIDPARPGDIANETITYYYSTTPFTDKNSGSTMAPDSPSAGIIYVRAVITSDNYSTYTTPMAAIKVEPAPVTAPSGITLTTDETDENVTCTITGYDPTSGYEYIVKKSTEGAPAVTVSGEPVIPDSDGKFNIPGLTPGESYIVYVRAIPNASDKNHGASAWTNATVTAPNLFSVVYDLNGGKLKTGEALTEALGNKPDTPATLDAAEGKVIREGYTFGGWSETKDGTTPVTTTYAGTVYAIWTANTYKVEFDANGGTGTMSDQVFTYEVAQNLSNQTFSHDGNIFVGWATTATGPVKYSDNQNVKNLTAENSGVITLYAVWQDSTYAISTVTITGYNNTLKLELKRGDTALATKNDLQPISVSGHYEASHVFTGIPNGTYNLVATQTVDGVDITTTVLVVISDRNVDAEVKMPEGHTSSKVEFQDSPRPVVVGGLDQEVKDEGVADRNVIMTMTITAVDENNVPETDGATRQENQNAVLAIESRVGDDVKLEYFNIEIKKDIKAGDNLESTEMITETDNIIELVIPYELPEGKKVTIYRSHNDQVEALRELSAKPAAKNAQVDGTYFMDTNENLLYIYSRKFSTYAIGISDKGTGGGGGGTPTPSYTPVITKPEHGTITVNPASPKADQNAVVTVTPEDGYETEDVIVKDKDGNTVPVTKNDDGTFTFRQPTTGPVTIEAVVKQATDLTPVIKNPEHGTISANPAKPKAGESAIITITTDEGYEAESVTVIDKEGNSVAVTKNADGTYSFVQPANGAVTIEVVLRLKDGVIVRFDLNGKTGTEPEPQTFVKGGKAVRPNDPSAEGYTFTGWYTDKECQNAYDFDLTVDKDLILYAGWEKKAGPGPDDDDDDFGIYFTELSDDPYVGVCYNEEANRYEIIYTGEPIRPAIRVTSKADGELKEGVDYTVSYSNNKNVSTKKPATITVKGKGLYKSKKVLELYILPADLETALDKGLLAGAEDFTVQSGKKLNPVIAYRGYVLKAKDRTISNPAAISAETTVDITGKGNFTGTLTGITIKVMDAAAYKTNSIKAALKAGSHIYNGEAQELTITGKEGAGELTVTAGSSKTPLEEGTDFTVSYSANVNAGTAKVIITGIGDKNGTVVKTFKIAPDKAVSVTAALADPDETVYYSPRGAMPEISVTAAVIGEDGSATGDTIELEKGRDYKVSYSKNKKVGNGTYNVTFLGNYKGHAAVKGEFKIEQAPLEVAEDVRVEAMQMVYKNPGKYLSKPFVSVDGVQLKKSDYTIKYYEGEVTDVTAEGLKELTAKDNLTLEADETEKTITIAVTAKGNYTGTALGYYEVKKPSAELIDLSKAKIVAKAKNAKGKDMKVCKQEYTGEAIEPEIRVLVKQGKTWIEVDPDKYEEPIYINNVLKGKATILITGNGEDTIGSRTANFTITNMNIGLFDLIRQLF